jgi:hypothetical protein
MAQIGLTTYVEVIQITPLISSFSTSNVILGVSRWQNPGNRFDVLSDGVVDIDDYNAILNYISAHGSGTLPRNKPTSSPYVDVNGDGSVTMQDANQLLAYLQSKKVIDTTATTSYDVSDIKIERDLINPSAVSTVKDVASCKNIFPTNDYLVYSRNLSTNELTEITYSTAVASRSSIVFVNKDVIMPVHPYTPGCYNDSCIFNIIKSRISQSEILPIRFNKVAGATGAISVAGAGLPMPGMDTSELPVQQVIAETTTTTVYAEQTTTVEVSSPATVILDPFPSTCAIIGEIKFVRTQTNGSNNASTTTCTTIMTSDVTPSPYIASADSEQAGAWLAFNGTCTDENDRWLSAATALPHYLQYDFNTAVIVNKYAIQERNSPNYLGFPKDFTLQGSNDNSTWTILDTRTSVNAPGPALWSSYFTFDNGIAYRYYRLNVTAVVGSVTYVSIAELKLVCASIDGADNTNTTTCAATMASDNVPVPNVVTASGEYYSSYRATNYSAWKAFSSTNSGESDRWISSSSVPPWYIIYDFGEGYAVPLNKYAIQEQNYNGTTVANNEIIYEQNYDSGNGFPKDFVLLGSNDGSNWTLLDSRVNIDPPGMDNWSEWFTFSNGVSYRYYKINITAVNGFLPMPVTEETTATSDCVITDSTNSTIRNVIITQYNSDERTTAVFKTAGQSQTTLYSNQDLLITFNAYDAKGVYAASLWLDGVKLAITTGPIANTTIGGMDFTVSIGKCTAGLHNYAIIAINSEGVLTSPQYACWFTVLQGGA